MVSNATFHFSHIYQPVFTTSARYIDIWGGRAAGRSHFGTDYFLYKITQPEYFRGCFMRHVFGDVRDSLFQDFKDRLEESDFDEADFEINESRMMVTYKPTGNTIISKGFRKSSGNRSAKLKSLAGITHVLIEEADENALEDVNKLDDSIRTDKIDNIQIIFLHNAPHKNHWICRRFYNLEHCGLKDEDGKDLPYYRARPKKDKDILVLFSTYKDNLKNLNAKTISKYENYNNPDSIFYDPEYYYIDVLGLIAEGVRGRIYKKFMHVTLDFFRMLPYPSYYGLDFGYSDDPIALVEIKSHNKRNFWHEVIYETGLTDPQLVEQMKRKGVPLDADIYADSSLPKSIQEIKDLGYKKIKPAIKGPDSVNFGIKAVISMENYMTDCSKNLWKENEEYKWKLDSDGQPTDEPVDKHNHGKDAGRYGITTHRQVVKKKKITVGNTREMGLLDQI